MIFVLGVGWGGAGVAVGSGMDRDSNVTQSQTVYRAEDSCLLSGPSHEFSLWTALEEFAGWNLLDL